MSYDIIKALHIISVISWMAGLLYLPRLFVYHAGTPLGSVQAETFKVMERRLLKAIMNPAMIASFIFGLWMLALNYALIYEAWFIIKFICVILMAACHGKFSKMRRLLENDEKPLSSKSYRVWNEVPTVLMIVIVVMAVVKPFS
ncbi:MAG: protoporphyrinogen oxidase HemJ [Candidatus Puniceispirillum sp.]|jgi:protoporphyrinogen IX oxidase|uniref:protoporphyrinogen oxidase HemJ n=1 Tax=Candidatus Puniceispirillum sp. TaxID=2026719 RepID=UPI001ECBBAB9|nr:protoporphyrinogen oxidase HemJ [Candidatus Puniceispirillum sp.]MBT6415321.1 protoporphyrinogen oxidase HemJ [Candidatus Puniceispirillum sp.]MBT6567006.1 protoporphyrinogen oxidase HemJ [Candidatus Puniceispirillum sp.]